MMMRYLDCRIPRKSIHKAILESELELKSNLSEILPVDYKFICDSAPT